MTILTFILTMILCCAFVVFYEWFVPWLTLRMMEKAEREAFDGKTLEQALEELNNNK